MRLRAPLRSLPRRIRERHALEIIELFDASNRPLTDWLEVVRAGLRLRLEDCMRSVTATALAIIVAASLVAFGYALAELEHGVRDVHRHWWAALPLAALVLSSFAWWALLPPRHQERA